VPRLYAAAHKQGALSHSSKDRRAALVRNVQKSVSITGQPAHVLASSPDACVRYRTDYPGGAS